jgi:hypothetical protein
MKSPTYTPDAIKATANHAEGHRYAPDVQVSFDSLFSYVFREAGDINSNIEEMAR